MPRILLFCGVLIALCSAVGWQAIDLPVLLSLEARFSNPIGLSLVFVGFYAIANLLILPATVFNLASGAIFGIGWGLAIASVSCWLSAVMGYAIARRLGQEWFRHKFSHRWDQIETNLSQGGLGYMILARILPVIPYGIVSFTAGCVGIKVKDFLLGTLIGTPLGLAPFVILGYGGKELLVSQDVLPLWLAIALVLIGTATKIMLKLINRQLAMFNYSSVKLPLNISLPLALQPSFKVASGIVFLIALAMRIWNINQIPYPVFDEVYFPKYTEEYLEGKPTWEGHPPLSKFLIMLGILTLGHNEFGYRIPTAIFGAIIPLLMIGICYQLTGKKWLAILVGCLYLTDGLFLVESRYGLINCFLVALGLAGQLLLLSALHHTGKYRWLMLAGSGILMSASASIKWNGLGFLLTTYLVSTLVLIVARFFPKQMGKLGIIAELNNIPFGAYLIYFFVLPVGFYIAQWIPHLMLSNGNFTSPISAFIATQKHILWWHSASDVVTTEPDKPAHPYCSPWYSWAVMARVVNYYFKADGDTYYTVDAMGNPILWWLTVASVLYLAAKGLIKFNGAIAYVLIGYSANYLPWMLPSRCLFLYHYMSALTFSMMALGIVLYSLWQSGKGWQRGLVISGAIAIVVSQIYFLPLWYGLPLSSSQFYQRIWFMPNQFGGFNWI